MYLCTCMPMCITTRNRSVFNTHIYKYLYKDNIYVKRTTRVHIHIYICIYIYVWLRLFSMLVASNPSIEAL